MTLPSVRALAGQLAAQTPELVAALTELVVRRVAALGSDAVERDWVRASVRANIELVLQVMDHPDELVRIVPPPGGVALVRRIAQHDVPFYEIVRGYQLAEWFWVQRCLRALAGSGAGADAVVARGIEVGELVHGYIDRVCGALSVEYEAERERWRRQAESARIGLVGALLRGDSVELAEAEAVLGYRLRQRHQAAVVWSAGRGSAAGQGADGSEFGRIKQVAARLAGGRGRPLVVARDHTTLWVWLPVPAGSPGLDADAVRAELAAEPDGAAGRVRVAVGEPAGGPAGFVASHRQAAAAHEIGLAAGADVGPVFPYRAVSSLTFLCADLPRARAWVADTLGPLAGPGPRAAELRRTLRAYSAAGRSATATARLLNCHKNTVQYRIRAAERLLGHAVADAAVDLDLALWAVRWLGATVFPPAVDNSGDCG